MSALKNLYSPQFYDRLANVLLKTIPDFNKQVFISRIFTSEFEAKELKERMRHTTIVLHDFFPKDFDKAYDLIEKTITELKKETVGNDSLAYIFFPDYIEIYGINNYETAVKAIEFTTQFITCEYAVRPFLIKYGAQMMRQMKNWSLHENQHVRRLASEGSRSKLPWAMALPDLKKNTEKVLEILENLKTDSSEYVRRSVANNLNDISKDHPEKVLEIAKKWRGISKETDAIIKHGARTLLKKGDSEILKFYGLESKNIDIENFKIATPKVKIGASLEFSFTLKNKGETVQTTRIEYGIYYKKSKGHLAKKVFKISERNFQPKEELKITRKQSFKIITTRVFYAGIHKLSIIINGEEKCVKDFEFEI